jgi:uncharacterized Zn-finger protein
MGIIRPAAGSTICATEKVIDMVKDVVTVSSTTVACEGKGAESGHPRVYLTFKDGSREVTCPYCSQVFALAEGAKAGH